MPENDRFYWNYRLNGQNETSCEYSVTGNKKNPTIILGNPEEASDEDASDIHQCHLVNNSNFAVENCVCILKIQ